MKIEVNISKGKFFVLLGVVLVLSGVMVAVALGTYNPDEFGHSLGEIKWYSSEIKSETYTEYNICAPGVTRCPVSCKTGDIALSGGFRTVDSEVENSYPYEYDGITWVCEGSFTGGSADDKIICAVRCLDVTS